MKGLSFKIDEHLHKQIRMKCFEDDISLKDYFTKLALADLKSKKTKTA